MKPVRSFSLFYILALVIVLLGAGAALLTGGQIVNRWQATVPGTEFNFLRELGGPFLLTMIGLFITGLLISGAITRPLRKVGAAMQRVARHDYAGEVPATHRGDEIGQIARSLMEMRDSLGKREAEIVSQGAVIDAIGSSQSMVSFDLQGKVLRVNQNFLRALGRDEAEVAEHHHSSLVDAATGGSDDYRKMWEALGNGETRAGTFTHAGPDGSPVYLQGAYSPVRDAAGELDRIIFVASDITTVETERLAGAKRRREMEAEQAQVVREVSAALADLAAGDLTVRIRTKFGGDYEALRENLNAATERLENAIAAVGRASSSIGGECAGISEASEDLSRRTENQAAALEETAASLEQLTASVRTAAEGAERASSEATATRGSVEKSGEVVASAVAAMGEIESSSEQISQIVGMIDDIAFQTSLLALNAGVEAARAGEAGRGFAVVASEVRALAQRSSDAAKEIKTLISTSSQQVNRGVELVRDTGGALQEIVGSIAGVSDLVSEIANASREQSLGLTEINAAVNQLDQVTQQNAAMVDGSASASHTMKSHSETLERLMGQFRTRALPAATPVPAPASAKPPVSGRRKPRDDGSNAGLTGALNRREQSVPVSQGSAALALPERDPVDEWEEF